LLRLPVPPLPEQTTIARFLDHETAKIDALIAEQQRLIELLKEKRQSLVLSSFSLTDTRLIRMKYAVNVMHRPVLQQDDEMYEPIGLYNRGRGLFHKELRVKQDMGDSDFFWIKDSDLIISGQFAWEGAVALAGEAEEGTVVSHRYPVIRGKNGVVATEYIFALLTTKHGDFLLNENSRGAAGRNRPLNLGSLLKEKIPVPRKDIQDQVVKIVHQELKIIREIKQQKDFFLERRSALISAAVTGKIDVRGWQPPATAATTPQGQQQILFDD
jgi:type I restriction enzyme S subunit